MGKLFLKIFISYGFSFFYHSNIQYAYYIPPTPIIYVSIFHNAVYVLGIGPVTLNTYVKYCLLFDGIPQINK